jgi:hypothetical protein
MQAALLPLELDVAAGELQMVPRDVDTGIARAMAHHLDGVDAVADPDLEYALTAQAREIEKAGDERRLVAVAIGADLLVVKSGSGRRLGTLAADRLVLPEERA